MTDVCENVAPGRLTEPAAPDGVASLHSCALSPVPASDATVMPASRLLLAADDRIGALFVKTRE